MADKGEARRRAVAAREAQRRGEQRRRRIRIGGAVVAIAAVVAVVAGVAIGTSGGSSHPVTAPTVTSGLGPEGIALESGTPLADLSKAATGATVDGIQCNPTEQVVYHIHTHLAVYVDGTLRPLPPGIGIVAPVAQQTANGDFYGASRCYYWLHVHAQDGVIHIESPTKNAYTLSQLFAEWGQPLSSSQVGPASGKLTVYVDEKPYAGDPAAIPLGSREDIQIDVGTDVAPVKVDWSQSQL